MGELPELLDRVLEAHGGPTRWQTVERIVIQARIGGIALTSRFRPFVLRSITAEIWPNNPRTIITPFPKAGQKGIFDEKAVTVTDQSGLPLSSRRDARPFFTHFRRKIYWDSLDVLYFAGYALWNYLNLPFLLAQPDIRTEEIAPWEADGEQWRRLHVVFPGRIPTHCREQVFSIDHQGLIVRHDYTAEVFGPWAKAAHYSGGYRSFSGLQIPTVRRVFPRTASGRPLRVATLVSIDITDVQVLSTSPNTDGSWVATDQQS